MPPAAPLSDGERKTKLEIVELRFKIAIAALTVAAGIAVFLGVQAQENSGNVDKLEISLVTAQSVATAASTQLDVASTQLQAASAQLDSRDGSIASLQNETGQLQSSLASLQASNDSLDQRLRTATAEATVTVTAQSGAPSTFNGGGQNPFSGSFTVQTYGNSAVNFDDGDDAVYDVRLLEGPVLAPVGTTQILLLDEGREGVADFDHCNVDGYTSQSVRLTGMQEGGVICVRTDKNSIVALSLVSDSLYSATFTTTRYSPGA